MSLVQRQLNFTFTLKSGTFAGGSNQLAVAGLRASVRIENAGGLQGFPKANITIWGLTKSQMNSMTTMGEVIQQIKQNKVQIEAGDAVMGFTTVFVGTIINAFADFSQPPQVAFIIVAYSAMDQAAIKATPASFSGGQSVDTLLSGISKNMGLPYRSNGISGIQLSNPYLWGTLRQQMVQVIRAADISWNSIEDGTVNAWPKNGSNGDGPVLISSQTGMVGSPSFTNWGIVVKTLYSPGIKNGVPLNIVSTQVDVPQGQSWNTFAYHLSLDAQLPHGEWFATLWASNPKLGQVTPVGG